MTFSPAPTPSREPPSAWGPLDVKSTLVHRILLPKTTTFLQNQNEHAYTSPPRTPTLEEQIRIQKELQRQQQQNAYMKQLEANRHTIAQIRKMLIIKRKANKNVWGRKKKANKKRWNK